MILNRLQKISPKIIRKMSESHLANGLVIPTFVPFIDDDDDDDDDDKTKIFYISSSMKLCCITPLFAKLKHKF